MIHLFRALVCLYGLSAFAQSRPDPSFYFKIATPMFDSAEGPVVSMDEAHNNYHTKSTGLAPLANLLAQDGFLVKSNTQAFTKNSLDSVDILVIVNPIHETNLQSWQLPCPSAFTAEEIDVLVEWIHNGGRLFLSADHMPIGGAVQELMAEFDVKWANCFDQSKRKRWPPAGFSRASQTLLSGPVTDSSSFAHQIDNIGTFTGSAFKSKKLKPFLVFDDSYVLLYPEIAWKFSKKTKRENAKGWFQGAYGQFGKGKIVLMGESAMFTAQLNGKTEIGMNSRDVPQNKLLAINIFRFLAMD